MAKKKETDGNTGLVRQFDDTGKKHPDAMLLFRTGDFCEIYRQGTIEAAAILTMTLTDGVTSSEGEPIKMTMFPYNKLGTYLPRLIRAGAGVTICNKVEDPKLTKMVKEGMRKEQIQSNHSDMAKRKRRQAVREEPVRIVKNAAGEKPAKEEKTGTAVKTKDGEEAKEEQERKPREPQIVTASGEKMIHGHVCQNRTNLEEWYFTAKMGGQQLKPQWMGAVDLTAYQKKELTVPQLMERYCPAKLMPKMPEEAFRMPESIVGSEGNITVEKFSVYKEEDKQRPDFGKYRFYVQVDEAKVSAVASHQNLNTYFNRVVIPEKLVEWSFDERLHLKSTYEKYRLPEGADRNDVRVAKDRTDDEWKVSVDMGERGHTTRQEISFDDGYSPFKAKTATREQIAAKYLNTEITELLAANTAKMEKSASMKM